MRGAAAASAEAAKVTEDGRLSAGRCIGRSADAEGSAGRAGVERQRAEQSVVERRKRRGEERRGWQHAS